MTEQNTSSQTKHLHDMFEQAVRLQQQGDHEAVVKHLDQILKTLPDQPQVLNMYALSLAELGEMAQAGEMLEKALKITPDFLDSWVNLGLIKQKSGDLDAAANAYDQYRSFNPESAVGHLNFANVRQLQKRFDEAAVAYEQALAITPDNATAWSNLSRASLHLGDWEKSAMAADRTLTFTPGHTGALAIKSVAMGELGRADEVARLVDFDRLIEAGEFTAPDGYADLKSFNAALCAHCLDHPTLVFEPNDNTTNKGHQSDNLSQDEDTGPIGELLKMIGEAVKRYQKSHPIDPSHPFLAQQPGSWTYDIWATILGSQGHQDPHIHRSGWLSGCYYAKIPDAITSNSGDQAGWIEFGRPQDHPMSQTDPVVKSYQPYEGMIVLFPSYFYHRTEPFVSDDKRISIAFDILPAA